MICINKHYRIKLGNVIYRCGDEKFQTNTTVLLKYTNVQTQGVMNNFFIHSVALHLSPVPLWALTFRLYFNDEELKMLFFSFADIYVCTQTNKKEVH